MAAIRQLLERHGIAETPVKRTSGH
jgi:hypothetical protein